MQASWFAILQGTRRLTPYCRACRPTGQLLACALIRHRALVQCRSSTLQSKPAYDNSCHACRPARASAQVHPGRRVPGAEAGLGLPSPVRTFRALEACWRLSAVPLFLLPRTHRHLALARPTLHSALPRFHAFPKMPRPCALRYPEVDTCIQQPAVPPTNDKFRKAVTGIRPPLHLPPPRTPTCPSSRCWSCCTAAARACSQSGTPTSPSTRGAERCRDGSARARRGRQRGRRGRRRERGARRRGRGRSRMVAGPGWVWRAAAWRHWHCSATTGAAPAGLGGGRGGPRACVLMDLILHGLPDTGPHVMVVRTRVL